MRNAEYCFAQIWFSAYLEKEKDAYWLALHQIYVINVCIFFLTYNVQAPVLAWARL